MHKKMNKNSRANICIHKETNKEKEKIKTHANMHRKEQKMTQKPKSKQKQKGNKQRNYILLLLNSQYIYYSLLLDLS